MASSSNPGNLRTFTVFIHHGGHLLKTPTKSQGLWLEYVGGLKYTLYGCNPDEWSLQEITGILKNLGYKGMVTIYYRKPGIRLDEGLVKVWDDAGAMKIAETALSICFKEVEVYVILSGTKEDGVLLTVEEEIIQAAESAENAESDESEDSEGWEWERFVQQVRFDDSEDEMDDGGWMDYITDCVEEPANQNEQNDQNEQTEQSPPIEPVPQQYMLDEGDKIHSDYESSELNTEEDDSNEDIESKEKRPKHVKYNASEMCKTFKFKLGMEFMSIKQFKEAIREWSLLNGWGLRFKKNDKVRCRVVCREGCDWTCLVSKVGGSLTYRLKTLVNVHSCSRTYNGTMASSRWVADKLVDTMKTNKKISLSGVIKQIKKDYCAEVSINKASIARRYAREKLEGGFAEQYAKLWDYCEEVKRTNPGSNLKILVDRLSEDSEPVFSRMYVCLHAIKTSFLTGCRPIIGLDGCFLKSPFGGILLVAIARDPNDEYFPLAVAVVESENKESWTWFMTNLLDDIDRDRRWVFISDQQKGLVPALSDVLEVFEHRVCVRHVYANMKKYFGGGSVLRDKMLAACKATYKASWERRMVDLKDISKDAHDWLLQTDPIFWAKSHFSEYCKSDMLMNNIAEAFNGRILEARDVPIISMFEWIRVYLMKRFAKQRLLVEKYRGKSKILPKPRKRLDKEVFESRKWTPTWAGALQFEVEYYPRQFTVDLGEKYCACRFWGLTGIPCRHAIAAIYCNRQDPIDYVDRYYWVDTYEQVYTPIINPINGEQMWRKTGLPPILPPQCRKRIGRPKKCRRREKDEPPKPNKLKRQNTSITCSKCGNYGHSKRICQNLVPPMSAPSRRGRGRGWRLNAAYVGRSVALNDASVGGSGSASQVGGSGSTSGSAAPHGSYVGRGRIRRGGNIAASGSGGAAASTSGSAAPHGCGQKKALRPKLKIQKGPGKWKGQACVTTQQMAKDNTQPSQQSRISKDV